MFQCFFLLQTLLARSRTLRFCTCQTELFTKLTTEQKSVHYKSNYGYIIFKMLPKNLRYPVIGFQVRRNSTVRGSKPDLSLLPSSLGQDFVSKMDKSSPYFPAFVGSSRALELLSERKAWSASPCLAD